MAKIKLLGFGKLFLVSNWINDSKFILTIRYFIDIDSCWL